MMKHLWIAALLIGCGSEHGKEACESTTMATHTPLDGDVSIYCVGDSTTQGLVSPDPQPPQNMMNAWRKALSDALEADKVSGDLPATLIFHWEGPIDSGQAPSNHHDGLAGETANHQFTAQLANLPGYVTQSKVIVPVQIGLNDGAHPELLAVFPTSYLNLIRRAHNLLRDKHPRFIFGLINSNGGPGDTINAELPGLWAQLRHDGIEFETMSWAGYGYPTHPTQAGYDEIAVTIPTNYHIAMRAILGYPMP